TDQCCGTATTTVSDFSAPGIIPIPAAVWLFGSGLIGLVGMARRKHTCWLAEKSMVIRRLSPWV
ncbi:MAG: VPLPA-CTERM sorting domain-containing protein, partial [Pseudomonadota bacterium]